jgi:methyl-accepting chemotaxis protein
MANLTDRQWKRIKERLDRGDKPAGIAKHYNISASTIYIKFSDKRKELDAVVNQIVTSNEEISKSLSKFPAEMQLKAWDMASELMFISKQIASGAKYGAMTFNKLSGAAYYKSERLDQDNIDLKELAEIGALTRVANDASTPAFSLLNKVAKNTEPVAAAVPALNIKDLSDMELLQFEELMEKIKPDES